MRITLLIGILLILVGVGLVGAQTDIRFTIFLDNSSLIVYVAETGFSPISLQGFAFETVIEGRRETFYLEQYPIFQALRFDRLPAPLCFRLRLTGTTSPLPLDCNPDWTFDQQLSPADVFWYDEASAQRRTLLILGGGTNAICPAGRSFCERTYTPPTISPTLTPSPTADITSTSLPVLPPTPDIFVLAEQGVMRNNEWTPYFDEINGVTMALVPVGCFQMGNDPQASYWDRAQGVFVVGVPSGDRQCFEDSFWIGRTEITNLEFGQFIAAGGYTNPTYWIESGWQWRVENNVLQPLYWTDSTWNQPEYPVVGVSWYEAYAYATWKRMRLPTEAEWEYAARGVEASKYPWGDEFDGTRLNFCDVNCELAFDDDSVNDGFRNTSPVGSFHAGASWVGALDMSGNVWEWTSSVYQLYPYNLSSESDFDSPNLRTMRSGSWGLDSNYARAAFRSGVNPVGQYNGLGFRVVS